MSKRLTRVLLCSLVIAGCGTNRQEQDASPERAAARLTFERQMKTLEEMTASVNAGDAARYARLYAQDATITIFGGGELKGRPAIEQHELALLREFPGTTLGFFAVWHSGRQVAVHYGVSGRNAAGKAMGHEGLLFFAFDATGLIVDEHRYLDAMTPMAQLGALGSIRAREVPILPRTPTTFTAAGSSTERENLSIVRVTLAAFDSKSDTAFLSRVHDAATFDELVQHDPALGANAWLTMWKAAVPTSESDLTNVLAVGDFVLVEAILRGSLNGTLGHVSAANARFVIHRASIMQLRAGKISRMSGFMNGKELAEAVGAWPPAVRR